MDDQEDPMDFRTLLRRGQDEALDNLRDMVNDPDRSDVVFRCSDGKTVHASRWLLASRCHVLDRMLNNGMSETNLTEIPLPTIPSRVMLSIVEFLYVGTMDEHPLDDWEMNFEMIRAAQYLMIPTAELIARSLLKDVASGVCLGDEQADLMSMLSEAVEFHEAWEGKDALLSKLMLHINYEWDLDGCCRISRNAVEFMLSNYRRELDQGENQPSLLEYCILCNIVNWHFYQVADDTDSILEAVDMLPRRESLWSKMLIMPDIDKSMLEISTSTDPCDSTAVLNSSLGVQLQKDSLEQMLQQYVNLSGIPASLLVTVIHPLRLFPPGRLLKGLVFRSVCQPVQRQMFRNDWKWSFPKYSITVDPDGCISHNGTNRHGKDTVVGHVPQPKSSETFEWSFRILEDEVQSIDLGFICLPRDDYKIAIDIEEDAKCLRNFSDHTRIMCIDRSEGKTSIRMREKPCAFMLELGLNFCSDTWEDRWEEVKLNSEVTFRFSMSQKNCQVSFGGCVQGVWWDLPGENFLPAVCFNKCNSGKVQFMLGSGFDYF